MRRGELRRREFLQAAAGAGALAMLSSVSCGRPRATAPKDAPSFLVFVTDDHRADALGCAGNAVVRTPSIDALAAAGTLFGNHFVTTAICPVSRASLHTGQWASRHGVWGFSIPLSAQAMAGTYSSVLRDAGWRTGLLGKWGIGKKMPADAFDEFRGYHGSQTYLREDEAGRKVHDALLLEEQAVAFLRASTGGPFCLTVCFKAPHGPFDADPPGCEVLYADTPIPELRVRAPAPAEPGEEDDAHEGGDEGPSAPTGEQRAAWLRKYYRQITGADAALGRIVAEAAKLGVADRTVVLFTSDNGMLQGEHGRRGKWLMYEESIRVPLIVADPAAPAAARGRREQRTSLNVDVAPTILARAGIAAPAGMQGASLLPSVRGEEGPGRAEWFYEFRAPTEADGMHAKDEAAYLLSGKVPPIQGVRTERWKYVRRGAGDAPGEELYDLAEDPGEERNRAADPSAAAELERLRGRWRELAAAAK